MKSALDYIGIKAKGSFVNGIGENYNAFNSDSNVIEKKECPDKKNYEARRYMAEIRAKRRQANGHKQ